MKKLLLCLLVAGVIASAAFAGTEYSGKEMKQVAPPPCPEWYADREFNVSLWGTYAFVGHDWVEDRYIEANHAWGGGVDFSDGIFQRSFHSERNAIGAVLGTLTLRYPIRCTRFAPYIFGGAGGIFGGGQRPINKAFTEPGEGFDVVQTVGHTDAEARAIGQVGGGMEIRFTPLIGWVSDFSWNFVDGPHNNFGMVRTGVNFA